MTRINGDPCELLDWDTAFFGFRIGRVCSERLTQELVIQINEWSYKKRVNCLYFLSRSDDAETTKVAENNNFRFVDIRLTFVLNQFERIKKTPKMEKMVVVRNYKSEDISFLQTIARDGYHDTRFHFDPHFPSSLSQLLYQKWIALSCEGYADVVLVAEFDNVPVGYISCHLDRENMSGKIGLVGVSNKARGQGIGQMLVLKALEWFIAHHAQEVSVVTQGRNVGAQRLYQRGGFLTQTVQLWYHKWYILPEGVL